MGVVAASFCAATVAVVALSLPLGWRHPAFRASLLMLACWSIANLAEPFLEPWLDAGAFYVCLGIWGGMKRPRPWPLVLAGLFLAQMVVHVVLSGAPWPRALALNVLFAGQLLVILTGTLDGLAALWRRRADRRIAGNLAHHSRDARRP